MIKFLLNSIVLIFFLATTGAQWLQLGTNMGLPSNSEKIQTIGISGSNLIISTLDNGLYLSSDNGNSWRKPSGTYPSNPLLNGGANLNGKLFFGTDNLGVGVYVTSDNGENWNTLSSGLVDGSLGITGNRLLGEFNGKLFLGAAKFYVSEDEGQNWQQSSNGLPVNPLIFSAAYDGTNYYCADKLVYKSTDAFNWNTAANTNLPFTNIKQLHASGNNLLAVPQSMGVFVSTDQGDTWTETLSEATSYLFEWNGTLYAAATWIYVSNDNGLTWSRQQETGIQPSGITVLNANSSFLFAGQNRTSSGNLWRYDLTTSVEQINQIPAGFELKQNFPNPFNPTTKINFSIPERGFATLKVYDLLGNQVEVLVDEELNRGIYSLTFDAASISIASGTYFYKLDFNGKSLTKKLLLIK